MSPFKVKGCFRRVTFLPFGDEVLAYFSGSAECVVVVHRESFSLPPLAPLPHLHPSLHLALPPPHWELCNPLQGERNDGKTVCVCVMERWMDGERKRDQSVYESKIETGRGENSFIVSSSFIHHSHPLSHVRLSFTPLPSRSSTRTVQPRLLACDWLSQQSSALKGQQPSLPQQSTSFRGAWLAHTWIFPKCLFVFSPEIYIVSSQNRVQSWPWMLFLFCLGL